MAKREETRVGSHKIDTRQYHRHQNEYNNEVLVRDGKPEEIAEIHDATKTVMMMLVMKAEEERRRGGAGVGVAAAVAVRARVVVVPPLTKRTV